MPEATDNDLRAAEQALRHVTHQARLALCALEASELLTFIVDPECYAVAAAIEDMLAQTMRDAEAAGDKLTELKIGGSHE
ncbi:hypothetical protein [Thiomonas sp. FB-6]|uniref:hypothetical protein n=1 Tax=Thiomonas sp. FB-6 TaxID=1158291 RepID=UPI0003827B18|nr:hypothetical protein [Thiomonas sp. FB-6]